ncbi:MAG: hypothetical protein IJ009_03475 [Clostridia bacterium]|nr:hypothetical protein [Clostridia bacterium]
MVRRLTEEEKRLAAIYEPYFDYKTCELVEDAPVEAVEALKKLREMSEWERDPNII